MLFTYLVIKCKFKCNFQFKFQFKIELKTFCEMYKVVQLNFVYYDK